MRSKFPATAAGTAMPIFAPGLSDAADVELEGALVVFGKKDENESVPPALAVEEGGGVCRAIISRIAWSVDSQGTETPACHMVCQPSSERAVRSFLFFTVTILAEETKTLERVPLVGL